MYTLGLNVYHGDASTCLFKNGKIIFAAEEERYTRQKHSAGFPINAIKKCLISENITIEQVDFITINRNPKNRIFQKFFYALKNPLKIKNFKNRLKNFRNITSLENEISRQFAVNTDNIKKKIINFDHHLSHAASSVVASNFNDTNYVTIDGFGDFLSTTIGRFRNKKFKVYKEVKFPHSLGIFYTSITQFLGFKKYGDEYKVMGLASYGFPKYVDQIREIIKFDRKKLFELNLDYFVHHDKGVEMSWLEGEPKISSIYSKKLSDVLGNERSNDEEISQRHKDIAASAQKVYEEILFKILDFSYELNNTPNLCLSGGCAMNSVANGKIIHNSKYKNIYINHSPGDSGGAIGSALLKILDYDLNIDIDSLNNPYLGDEFSDEKILSIVNQNSELIEKNIYVKRYDDKDQLFREVANNISQKKIVGFFYGKMEFGSRALGARSILADPRAKNIKEILNLKIKRRENFRPFAPSILEEHTKNWFEIDDKVPFMSKVYKFKKEKINDIPAVVHVDGTGRLQTVSKKFNSNFYSLIQEFYKITKIPLILNTSFNENEPIVCSPEEALKCFLRTKMDILVLENFILSRN